MAGFKRGGFRGGGGGTFKKGYAKKRSSPDEDDSAPRANKKTKANDEEDESAIVVPKLEIDGDNNHYIALNASGKRRVTVSDYNKSTLISIREYWVNDGGELKPGKKGISLTIDQYNTLLAAAPLLESVLAQKDIEVVRPDYHADFSTKEEAVKEGEEEEDQVKKVDDEEEEE
ncbi:Nn.00g106790.m01.CDS01 [Neocucurbitaria sp. VM-36]